MAVEDQPTQQFDINGVPENLYEDFTHLRLDDFNSTCKTCSDFTHCSSCGFSIPSSPNISPSSNKRRSPNFTAPTSDQIPKRPKKLFHEPVELESNVAAASAIPSLRRCNTSPPMSSPVPVKEAAASVDNVHQSPPSKGTASLPPLPPFNRCSSYPSPMKSFSRSGSNNALGVDGCPDYQRLKWMNDRTKEMSQWFDDFLPEETVAEEKKEDKGTDEDNSTAADIIKANDPAKEAEEPVSVERTGESLIVHFKGPCSKGFQILLSGANCYYKLL